MGSTLLAVGIAGAAFAGGGIAYGADDPPATSGDSSSGSSGSVSNTGSGDTPAKTDPATKTEPTTKADPEPTTKVKSEPTVDADPEPTVEPSASATAEPSTSAEPEATATTEAAAPSETTAPSEAAAPSETTAPSAEPVTAGTGLADQLPAAQAAAVVDAASAVNKEASDGTSAEAAEEPAAADANAVETQADSAVQVSAVAAAFAAAEIAPTTTAATLAISAASSSIVVDPVKTTFFGVITSLIFGLITTVEAILTGPPAAPWGSNVTVKSSSLQLANGVSVPADWYFPTSNTAPTQMILLQHGFFAVGSMYSLTAARLAEATNSVVVALTITWNPFADGDMWLGGANAQKAVAALFTGDRSALTASAIAAGYATKYGLNAATAKLPTKFGLAGHSLGGGLVAGAAGYLAEANAAADLVGVVLFDAVPKVNSELTAELHKLDAFAASTGHFIPVRQIGAQWNLFNMGSTVNSILSTERPNRYAGVVLTGGVHSDSIQTASPLVAILVYLFAGWPTTANQLAVDKLSADWFKDWFAGSTAIGDSLVRGSTFTVSTSGGNATATVIGTASTAAAAREAELILAG